MANCFENIIGYKGTCISQLPTSGLYTDQIGLHKTEIEKYLQSPYANTDMFFTDMLNISIEEMTRLIYQHFAPTYRPSSIISNDRLGQYNDNMQLENAELNTIGGTEIEICNHVSPIEFYLSEFSLFIDMTTTVTVNVWDLQQNKVIDSFTVNTIANQISTAYPNISIKANRKKLNLFFAYDVSVIDSYQCQLSSSCNSCNPNSYYSHNSYLNVRGASIPSSADKVVSNVTSESHTFGMSFVYSVNCNHRDWICSVGNLLAMPLLYKTAYNILNYGLNASDRQNSKTIADRERIEARMKEYDFKFGQQLGGILNSISPPKDPICYECNDRYRTVTVLP